MSDPSKLSARYTTMVVAALSLIGLTCVAFLVPVPYVTMKPGPAFDTLGDYRGEPMFTFGKGIKTYPTSGSLDFTTVSVTSADGRLNLGQVLVAYLDKDVAVVPKSLIYPDDQSDEQSTEESAAQLSGSKDSSRVAALRAAGYAVPGMATIASVVKGSASDGSLRAGDVINTIDGQKISTPDEAVQAVVKHKPGETIRMSVQRDGKAQDFTITTRPDPEDADTPRIGVTLGTKYRYPFKIDNNVGREIGGPSAGTMFALAIYDKLTPGALTGGEKIAGTGEIQADGTVLPIGGIRQKMAGAQRDGARIFLVPAANCGEATDGDDFGMTLVKVSTLETAISSLEELAKDDKASVPTCS